MSRPGLLDQRILINRVTNRTPDGMGGFTETETEVFDGWAAVDPSGGTETQRADRVNAEATVMFTIRNRPDLDLRANDRIVWQGRRYNIRVPEFTGRRSMYLEIIAERGVAD